MRVQVASSTIHLQCGAYSGDTLQPMNGRSPDDTELHAGCPPEPGSGGSQDTDWIDEFHACWHFTSRVCCDPC